MSLRKVRVSPSVALSTLASVTVIVTTVAADAVSTYRAVTVKGTWTIGNLTSGEGPIVVGYAHSDYSVTEIKECLEAQLSINRGNKIANEQANRLVRVVGTLLEANQSLNDGKPMKTRLNWLINIGDNVNMFAYNDSATLLTTGSNVRMTGEMYVNDTT